MQESENKGRHAAKHASAPEVPMKDPSLEEALESGKTPEPSGDPENEPIASAAAAENSAPAENGWDEDLFGSEDEVPLRMRKKTAAKRKETTAPRTRVRKKVQPKGRRRVNDESQTYSEKAFRRKKSLFEIMGASGGSSRIKPIHIFGHEIRFWPLILALIIVLLLSLLVVSNGDIDLLNETVTVVGVHDDLEKYKILVLSDMNAKRFGDRQATLTRRINNTDYDLLLCLGDMVGAGGDYEPFIEFLSGLSSPGKVYFICGDSDPGPFVDTARNLSSGTLSEYVLQDWILEAVKLGAHYVDAPVKLTVGEANLWLTPCNLLNTEVTSLLEDWRAQEEQEEEGTISGLTGDYNSVPFTSYRRQIAEKTYAAYNSMRSTDMMIALAHQVPDKNFVLATATHTELEGKFLSEPSLIVAGHNCGGVWQLPLIRQAFYVPNRLLPRNGWFPSREDTRGLSTVGGCQVYISGGLSTTASIPVLPFRLFNPPEMSVLTLTAKLQDNLFKED